MVTSMFFMYFQIIPPKSYSALFCWYLQHTPSLPLGDPV